MCYENNDIYLSMDGNLNLCRNNNDIISIDNELKTNDFLGLKQKIESYFELLGENCIYDKENKND